MSGERILQRVELGETQTKGEQTLTFHFDGGQRLSAWFPVGSTIGYVEALLAALSETLHKRAP